GEGVGLGVGLGAGVGVGLGFGVGDGVGLGVGVGVGVGVGGGRAPAPMGVVMSDCICAWVNARLYTRTSSISPWKCSPVKAMSPPICNTPVEAAIVPVIALLATSVPFM